MLEVECFFVSYSSTYFLSSAFQPPSVAHPFVVYALSSVIRFLWSMVCCLSSVVGPPLSAFYLLPFPKNPSAGWPGLNMPSLLASVILTR